MNSTTDLNPISSLKDKLKTVYLEKQNQTMRLFSNSKYFSIVLKSTAGMLALVFLFYVLNHMTQTTKMTDLLQNKTQIIQRQIHELNAQLSELEKSKLNAHDEIDEEKMRKDILELQKNIASLASASDVSKISSGLEELKKHVSEMKKSLDTQNGQLPVSALPFEVQSMDVLNGVAYLTLINKHQLFTVKSGDSIGEWTVLEIAQNEKNAVFQNVSGEQVIVHLAK